ncbi:MAG: hypothetical protein LW595_04280 [Rickettsiales bacterium]|nr:hypothetical protein [Rickettsiales bacterium]
MRQDNNQKNNKDTINDSINKKVKLNPNNSESSKSDNSSEGFCELIDRLIEGLSNGTRFAITNFIIGLGLPKDIDLNIIVTSDFVTAHPLCRYLLTANDGITRSIAESIAVITQGNNHIHINDNLTATNLILVLQKISEHRYMEGVSLPQFTLPEDEILPKEIALFLHAINSNNKDPNIYINQNYMNNFINKNFDSYKRYIDNCSNQQIPNLQKKIIEAVLHNDLSNGSNECTIYYYIEQLHNISAVPLVIYPTPIDLNNYPNLSTIILDSVRNGGENLIIDENNLTANSTNLILQGILNGLNAENPQFQGLQSLQISSNVSDGDNVAMNEESMNLLSTILLHQNNKITHFDIRCNNIEPCNLNILLRSIAENPDLTANLQELDFSLNKIDQNSVSFLEAILRNNSHIKIKAEGSIPEGVNLQSLEGYPGFEGTQTSSRPSSTVSPTSSIITNTIFTGTTNSNTP